MADKYFLGTSREASDNNRLPSLGEIGLSRFAPPHQPAVGELQRELAGSAQAA